MKFLKNYKEIKVILVLLALVFIEVPIGDDKFSFFGSDTKGNSFSVFSMGTKAKNVFALGPIIFAEADEDIGSIIGISDGKAGRDINSGIGISNGEAGRDIVSVFGIANGEAGGDIFSVFGIANGEAGRDIVSVFGIANGEAGGNIISTFGIANGEAGNDIISIVGIARGNFKSKNSYGILSITENNISDIRFFVSKP